MKSYLLDFSEKATPAPRYRTAKLTKSSDMTVQRNSLRGCDSLEVRIPQLLRGTSGLLSNI
jgi:hypothetical protein